MLWVLPFVVGIIAVAASAVYLRGRRTVPADAGLSPEEENELQRIMAERDQR